MGTKLIFVCESLILRLSENYPAILDLLRMRVHAGTYVGNPTRVKTPAHEDYEIRYSNLSSKPRGQASVRVELASSSWEKYNPQLAESSNSAYIAQKYKYFHYFAALYVLTYNVRP